MRTVRMQLESVGRRLRRKGCSPVAYNGLPPGFHLSRVAYDEVNLEEKRMKIPRQACPRAYKELKVNRVLGPRSQVGVVKD